MLMLNRVTKRCQTCLIKQRSNPRNKQYLWIQQSRSQSLRSPWPAVEKRETLSFFDRWSRGTKTLGTRLWIQVKERAQNACSRKTCLTKPSKRTNVLRCLIKCLTPFKFYQTQPNTIKHDPTTPNRVSKRENVLSPNNVWSRLPNISRLDRA